MGEERLLRQAEYVVVAYWAGTNAARSYIGDLENASTIYAQWLKEPAARGVLMARVEERWWRGKRQVKDGRVLYQQEGRAEAAGLEIACGQCGRKPVHTEQYRLDGSSDRYCEACWKKLVRRQAAGLR